VLTELTLALPPAPSARTTGLAASDDGTVDVFDLAAREQGAFCLGCRACEPICPAGVPYGRLLEELRDAQWKGLLATKITALTEFDLTFSSW